MRLVLVRHGQTPSNISHALDTAMPGADLDEVGAAQAEELADNFEQLVGSKPSVIYVSPLNRTLQTAAPLAKKYGLTPLVREGIREVIAGDIEMSTKGEDIRTYLSAVLAWIDGDLDWQMLGGEDGWQTRARFGSVITEALSLAREEFGPEATVVLVAHGAIIRVISATLSGDYNRELVARYPMENAATTVLEWKGADQNWMQDRAPWQAVTWSDRPLDSYELTGGPVVPKESGLRSN